MFKYISIISAIILSLFHLYTAYSGIFVTSIVHYAIHLLLVMIIFLTTSKALSRINKRFFWIDLVFILAIVYAIGYIILNYQEVLSIMGSDAMNSAQRFSAYILLVTVLYSALRINLAFFILSFIMLLYGLFGNYLGGPLQHSGMDMDRLTYLISYTTDGIFGSALSIAATYLFIFIFFGVVMEKTGTGDLILKSSQSLVGKYRGGTAKTSVLASAGMGSVVGSSMGNVVSTGTLTIPVMKKSGFKPHVAAAFESVASEGGQILPPILGAAAFIMASITGISYVDIVIASIIPALLYFLSVFMVVDFEAKKHNIRGLSKNELPNLKNVLKDKGHLVLAVFLLVYLLLFQGMGVMKSGFFAIIALIILAMVRKNTRLKAKDFLSILINGAIGAIEISIICATMGIITGVIAFSGIGARLSSIIVSFSNGSILLTLLTAVIVTIILGMGLPTPVAYLMAALFVSSGLVEVGVPLLAAHLFLLYFAVKSGTTPPVAIVAVVAAGIAKANWFKTAMVATLFSIPSYIIAFTFIYRPELLFQGSWLDIALVFLITIIGVIGVTGGIQGWWLKKTNLIERLFLITSSILTVFPNYAINIIGILGIVALTFYQYVKLKDNKSMSYQKIDESRFV